MLSIMEGYIIHYAFSAEKILEITLSEIIFFLFFPAQINILSDSISVAAQKIRKQCSYSLISKFIQPEINTDSTDCKMGCNETLLKINL